MEDVSKNTVGASSGGRSAVSRIGRKGDARMHKALQARLQNPKLTHVEALIEGGFDIPLDDLRDHVIIDGVSLGQRKNQFCRRLRSMKRNLDGEETSRNSASDKTDDNDEPSQSNERNNKSKRLPTSNLPKMMNDSHPNPSGEPSHSTSNTPSIPLTNNPTKSEGTHNNNPLVAFPPFVHQIPGSSLSLADAQRAAIESIQQRAEKQSRRRSSAGTTTFAPPRRSSMNSSTSTSMNSSHLTNHTTTTQDGEDKRMKFDEARSSIEASMLAQHHQHQQQQLSQFLSSDHPYQATLMNHFAAGISPSYAAVLNGLAAAYTPSATTTNSSSSGFLSQALAATSVNPTTAIHPQALSLSMMNNPLSFSTYLNAFGQQHIQQLEAKSQMDFNNNNNALIDHKISQFIQKSIPPATTESRNGSEFTRVSDVHSSNSKFDKLRNESYNYTTTTTTNTPIIRKEGGKELMKRRDSSSEALQLFARLNASNLEKRRSGQLSETKIQPAADLTSVLLSDAENSSEEEGSVGVNDSHQLSNGKKQKPVSISQTSPPEEEEEARSAAIRNFHSNLAPSIRCIRVPNIETAIRQYQTDNNEALKQAMQNAGFCPPHTSESSPTFAHFALLAIEEERRRLLKLKANIENKRSEMSSGK